MNGRAGVRRIARRSDGSRPAGPAVLGDDDGMPTASRARLLAGLMTLATLAVLGVLSVLAVMPSAPRPADAPADEFSADRAFLHVERIGQRVDDVTQVRVQNLVRRVWVHGERTPGNTCERLDQPNSF